jgi:hypothetical protein
MKMIFRLEGITIPGGTPIKDAIPYASIEAALEAAKQAQGAIKYRIIDQDGKEILSFEEVCRRLKPNKSN